MTVHMKQAFSDRSVAVKDLPGHPWQIVKGSKDSKAAEFERVMTEVAAWKRAVEAAGDPRMYPATTKIAAA